MVKQKQMMEFEIIEESPDGSVIYETVVNSLSEIASWIIGRGDGVVVLEPASLKRIVINIANQVLANYKQ